MSTELSTVQTKARNLRDYLSSERIKSQIAVALPKWLSVDRLLRVVFSAAVRNPTILECTTESILQSVMQCAQLGLEPILGRGYLIPYQNNKQTAPGQWTKVYELQFQPGYQGLVDLARRSGDIRDVFAAIVYEKDEFEYELGTNKRIKHKPCVSEDPGKPIGAYCVWELKDGVKHFDFMTLHEIYKRRDRSQSYQFAIKNPDNKKAQDCPWIQWPEEQIKKTVIKYSSKLMPASVEFMQAVELDSAIESGSATQIGSMFEQLPEPENQIIEQETVQGTPRVDELIATDPATRSFIEAKCVQWGMTFDEVKEAAEEHFDDFFAKFSSWKKSQPEFAPKQTRRIRSRKQKEQEIEQQQNQSQHPAFGSGLEETDVWQHLIDLKRTNPEAYFEGKKALGIQHEPRDLKQVGDLIAYIESLVPTSDQDEDGGPPPA